MMAHHLAVLSSLTMRPQAHAYAKPSFATASKSNVPIVNLAMF
jgi:hypothetical protein